MTEAAQHISCHHGEQVAPDNLRVVRNQSSQFVRLTVYEQLQRDPTHTTTLRNQFSRAMGKRFRELRGLIRKAIVDRDCFGLQNNPTNQNDLTTQALPQRRQFDFPRSQDKVSAFMDWLRKQEDQGILEIRPGQQLGEAVDNAWTNTYIDSAYQKGIVRGRQELRQAGYTSRAGDPIPALEEPGEVAAAFNQPFHMDRVGLMYTRTFNELKGITDAMDQQISRVLSQAMAEGRNPNEIARLLTRTISGPSGDLGLTDTLGRWIPAERRARIMARTEVIRSHHVATIQEYRNWQVEGVKVQAEWSTAGDARVCRICATLEGSVYDLKTIEGMIPRHPQCRCIALPLDVTDEGVADVEKAVEEVVEDPVARKFIDSSEVKEFIRRKQEYRQWIDEQIDDAHIEALNSVTKPGYTVVSAEAEAREEYVQDLLNHKFDEEFPTIWQGAKVWQTSTWESPAINLKLASVDVERPSDMLWRSSFDDNQIQKYWSKYRTIETELRNEYIKMRAFNQAYMERCDIEKVQLYRGIGGKTGKKIAFQLQREGMKRGKFDIQDAPLTGYTDVERIGRDFGDKIGGIMVSRSVPREDIVVHKDLLAGVLNNFEEEGEHIIRGGGIQITKDQIQMPESE